MVKVRDDKENKSAREDEKQTRKAKQDKYKRKYKSREYKKKNILYVLCKRSIIEKSKNW